jgi:hypothetical protein
MHYARELLESYDDIANADYDIKEYYHLRPQVVLEYAYRRTMEDAKKEGIVGSTTALLVLLRVISVHFHFDS